MNIPGDPALDWVMQIAQFDPISLTLKDVFLQIQSDSAEVRPPEVLEAQVDDNWINGLQTDLQMAGTSPSLNPMERMEVAKVRTRLEMVE